jgi:hypothetical protein
VCSPLPNSLPPMLSYALSFSSALSSSLSILFSLSVRLCLLCAICAICVFYSLSVSLSVSLSFSASVSVSLCQYLLVSVSLSSLPLACSAVSHLCLYLSPSPTSIDLRPLCLRLGPTSYLHLANCSRTLCQIDPGRCRTSEDGLRLGTPWAGMVCRLS